MAWDSHIRGYTGLTARRPGEAPITFKNTEDYLQWQKEQDYKNRTKKRRLKAAGPSVAGPSAANRPENAKQGRKGKGVAQVVVPAKQDNIDDDDELHDLFMSVPDEITWSSGNNEVGEGGKVGSEGLKGKAVKAGPNEDDDELHDLFMSEPNKITWSSEANEAVKGKEVDGEGLRHKSVTSGPGSSPSHGSKAQETAPPAILSLPHTAGPIKPPSSKTQPLANSHTAGLTPAAPTSASIMASPPKAPAKKAAFQLALPASPPPKQPAFPLTLPASPPPREQPAPVFNTPRAAAPQGNPLLLPLANMSSPAENPAYGRMAHEMRENMKHSKTTVIFSPGALAGPSDLSFAANTPTGGLSNKRNATSDFEDRFYKRVSREDSISNAQVPQSGSQSSGLQNIATGTTSAELDPAVDQRVVQLIRKAVNSTIKKTLDEVKDHKTVYGMPIWPDAFPLKHDGQEKVRRTHEAAVQDVLESLLCPDSNGQIPMADLGQILGSLIPVAAPIINDTLSQSNLALGPMVITPPKPVASLGNDNVQTTGVNNGKGKGVCVPNVVQVDGGVGLLINGGKGFVPLPGLPKSHQKKSSKGKAVVPATVHQNDSAALQDALRTGDVARAQEIASRIFPVTPAPGGTPEATPKRKRTPAKPKATEPKATGGKKKVNVNQSLDLAVDNTTDGAAQNQAEVQVARSTFLPFPTGDPVMAGPSQGVGNEITEETLNSFDLDELLRQTFGVDEVGESSSSGHKEVFDGSDFDFTLHSALSQAVNPAAESEDNGQSIVSAGEGAQIFQKSNEVAAVLQAPGPVNHFDASFDFQLDQSVSNVATTSSTTQPSTSSSGRFYPFPSGGSPSGAAVGNSTSNAVEWAIPSQGQTSAHTAGATPLLTFPTGKVGTQVPPETATEGSGSQTIAPTNDTGEDAELATAVANTLKDLRDSGLTEYSAEDLMAAQHKKSTIVAVAEFMKDEVLSFMWSQALEEFCADSKLPFPCDVSFEDNATAPKVSGDLTRVWKSQDKNFCSDYSSNDIMWGAAVYAFNSTPARYRFAKNTATGTVEPITPFYFFANWLTISLYRDPHIFPILGTPKETVCEWALVKDIGKRDNDFAAIISDIYPEYRDRVTWNVDYHTVNPFNNPKHD